jgi:hypothetical protein
MKPVKHIENLIKNQRHKVRPQTHDRVLNNLMYAWDQHKNQRSLTQRPLIWRFIMNRPKLKLTIAATVLLTCAIMLPLWHGTGASVALADALVQIEAAKAYICQISITTSIQTVNEDSQDIDTQGSILVSPEYGTKLALETFDPESNERIPQEIYILTQEKVMITVLPTKKQYTRMPIDATITSNLNHKNRDPQTVIQRILNCDKVYLGQSEIEGVIVDGFQTTDPNYANGSLGQVDVKIWIDVETELPIRLDMTFQMNDQAHQHIVMDDYHWDIAVNANEFNPNIPADYINGNDQENQSTGVNENTAIAGLTFFRDYMAFYPKNLHIVSLLQELQERSNADTEENKQIQQRIESLSEEEQQRLQKQTLPTMMGLSTFSTMMGTNNKGYAYHGEYVTPEDSDQVLMRWKISESEYRVIFGDLHAETISIETLKELEKEFSD